MDTILKTLIALSILISALCMISSKSVMHEIFAVLTFMPAALSICTLTIIETIKEK